MIRKPGHGIHWAMHVEKRSSQFFMTPRIMFCQNLRTGKTSIYYVYCNEPTRKKAESVIKPV
jgi:hypothetical protein